MHKKTQVLFDLVLSQLVFVEFLFVVDTELFFKNLVLEILLQNHGLISGSLDIETGV